MQTQPNRIALIHDWLAIYTGSEKVLEQILSLYPAAHLFSLVEFLPPDQRAFIQGKPVKTSFIQHLPLARQRFRSYLPLMPIAIEQFDLTSYDLIISSSHAVAKGVITGPHQLHISYIHSPIRYAWDMQHEYLREAHLYRGPKSWLARLLLHYIRLWDTRTTNSIDAIATNSNFIARRIWKIYRRQAQVIYPPVDTHYFQCHEQKEDFYLAVSRMVPYKKISLIVEAFSNMPHKRLVLIGDGPQLNAIRRMATGNITVMGYQPAPIVADYMRRAHKCDPVDMVFHGDIGCYTMLMYPPNTELMHNLSGMGLGGGTGTGIDPFITNKQENKLLRSGKWQREFARNLADGIESYLRSLEHAERLDRR